ncbi:DNA mismatch repair endonuclease MutL [Sinanaerobacter chloroacetimidivorans]|uniref:DNA mismatch repair protein MutL n=1 Tax=Sinanaerobacter chloroacetimidivorans TaxID=2818044 RepID=A0A8J7VXK7_9FIRM|nr:DNA mismatch repair endonuclease MutL [Sinanaerobacter chloroacetimidivorans]MBR0596614.1 DNA mismatch repair endonuclease MutL [Sinanaerobacter chloroacetimidivorans]
MDIIEKKRITELPKHVADKIAAGEVVDRPLSIVKELVENAIDAGSTSIVVEIKNGGKSYIRVTDNGSGIEKGDVELAFKRHATSKIRNASDLDSIQSLGFRGEALASIAAVSRTELITKTADEKSGIRIRLEGGDIAEKVDTGCPEGTTVIIEDLFFNTPARLKFMKPDATESTLIIDFISKMALAYAQIKFRLINNGNILFSTTGKGDIYSNILTIYSKDLGDKLIHFKEKSQELTLEAFVSAPSQSKTNRKSQIFFVNGRSIASKVMENAVTDAYSEKLFEGRYPIAFLFLQVSPDKLDVNIHPNKKEVRFDDERAVRDFIGSAIRTNLNSKDAIAEIKKDQIIRKDSPFKMNQTNSKDNSIASFCEEKEKNVNEIETQVDIKKLLFEQRQKSELEKKESLQIQEDDNTYRSERVSEMDENTAFQTNVEPTPAVPADTTEKEMKSKTAEVSSLSSSYAFTPLSTIGQVSREKRDFEIEDIFITGSVFGTYITGTDHENFYLIDQHAAHERVFYEQLLDSYEKEEKLQQTILTPFIINVSYAVKNDSLSMLDFLGNMGFEIEEFGPSAFIVKAVPMFMDLDEAKDFIEYLLDNISEDADLINQKKIDKIITNACKKAVKAHDLLDLSEIRQLMADLAKTKNPYSCPHGRPTVVKMSKYEIEKMFKRV